MTDPRETAVRKTAHRKQANDTRAVAYARACVGWSREANNWLASCRGNDQLPRLVAETIAVQLRILFAGLRLYPPARDGVLGFVTFFADADVPIDIIRAAAELLGHPLTEDELTRAVAKLRLRT